MQLVANDLSYKLGETEPRDRARNEVDQDQPSHTLRTDSLWNKHIQYSRNHISYLFEPPKFCCALNDTVSVIRPPLWCLDKQVSLSLQNSFVAVALENTSHHYEYVPNSRAAYWTA